jgi:hypothetical protein
MGIIETFTKRQERLANAGKQDIYQYDDLPTAFRVQVIHIWKDAIGKYYRSGGYATGATQLWDAIHDALARERGEFLLSEGASTRAEGCQDFILKADTAGALDIIELSFRAIDMAVREMSPYDRATAQMEETPDQAIEELNGRFREHGIGYQYVEGILVRLDSQFAHAELVKPALGLLNAAGFDGPADEFIRAFAHYRHGRHKEAIAEALKAFESTMKSICAMRKWAHPPTATAKQLIEVLFDKGLVPKILEAHFTNLRVAMESGLPTLRNKTSGHGQGAIPVAVPPHFAGYALHLMASNIIFLVEAHKALP